MFRIDFVSLDFLVVGLSKNIHGPYKRWTRTGAFVVLQVSHSSTCITDVYVFYGYFSLPGSRSLEFLADWPVNLLLDNPENCLFHYFR